MCVACKLDDINQRRNVEALTYREYLASPEWAAIRHRAMRLANFQCEHCGTRGYLEVHHRHYDKPWGTEVPGEDLEVLCKPCHETADEERRDMVQMHRWDRRVWGWKAMCRRRGIFLSYEQAEAALDQFLQEQGDDDEEW